MIFEFVVYDEYYLKEIIVRYKTGFLRVTVSFQSQIAAFV